MIQDSKNMWMCVSTLVSKNGIFPAYESISYTRSESIKAFLENTTKNWRWWKRKGWQCIKVDVSYKEVKP